MTVPLSIMASRKHKANTVGPTPHRNPFAQVVKQLPYFGTLSLVDDPVNLSRLS